MDANARDSLFRSLFESAGDAILLIDGDVIVACNQATLDVFGCTRDRIIGKQTTDLAPAAQPDGNNSAAELSRHGVRALDGEVQRFQFVYAQQDGTPFDADVTLGRVDVGGQWRLQAIIRDITERVRLEKERARLIAIVESTPDYVGIAKPDGTSIYLNDSFGRIMPPDLRAVADAGRSIPITAFYGADAGAQLTEVAVPAAVRHGFWQGESMLLDSRGQEFAVLQTVIAHTDMHGTFESFSVILREEPGKTKTS